MIFFLYVFQVYQFYRNSFKVNKTKYLFLLIGIKSSIYWSYNIIVRKKNIKGHCYIQSLFLLFIKIQNLKINSQFYSKEMKIRMIKDREKVVL